MYRRGTIVWKYERLRIRAVKMKDVRGGLEIENKNIDKKEKLTA